MADPEFKFQRQHRSKLAELLKPAESKCRQLCIALKLPYKRRTGDAKEELYITVIDKIISKGVSKQELIGALRSSAIGHGNLADEFDKKKSIHDNKHGIKLLVMRISCIWIITYIALKFVCQ